MLTFIGIILTISGVAGFLGLTFLKAQSGGTTGILTSLVTGTLVALGVYLLIGSPGKPDQPIRDRVDELAQRDLTSLTGFERLAYEEQRKRDEPDNPAPHLIIGEILLSQRRPDDARRAFQSAARRDPDGQKNARGFAEFGIGYCDWLLGNQEAARTRWLALIEALPEGPVRSEIIRRISLIIESSIPETN
ncbi:MAG: tetratricopeptide repeat protein [Pseudomonadota bacterium]